MPLCTRNPRLLLNTVLFCNSPHSLLLIDTEKHDATLGRLKMCSATTDSETEWFLGQVLQRVRRDFFKMDMKDHIKYMQQISTSQNHFSPRKPIFPPHIA